MRAYLDGRPAGKPVWPGTWSERSAIMFKLDLDRAGIELATEEGEALFHSLIMRHSYTTLLAAVAPVKVTQELSRHSTPVLTIGRYAHAGMSEKAEAVGKMAIPGSADATPIPRADLEGLVAILLALTGAVLESVPRSPGVHPGSDLRTPPRTPVSGIQGDSGRHPDTNGPKKRPPRGTK